MISETLSPWEQGLCLLWLFEDERYMMRSFEGDGRAPRSAALDFNSLVALFHTYISHTHQLSTTSAKAYITTYDHACSYWFACGPSGRGSMLGARGLRIRTDGV